MNWTKEQNYAIDLPVSDMIVSAAAGSGKTAVMAERILKRLTDPENSVDIDRILVVTYTSAAASEIKERIMKKVLEELDNGYSEKLSSQLLKLPYAHISTIHSFCLELIKKYFYVLGIDPNVKIADQTDVNVYKKKAAQKVIDAYYDSEDSVFKSLVCDYTHKNDNSFSDLIIKIYDFSRTMPNPEKWLDSLKLAYTKDFTRLFDTLTHYAHLAGQQVIKKYETIIEKCGDDIDNSIIKNFIISEKEKIQSALSNTEYEALRDALLEIKYENWRLAKGPDHIRPYAYNIRKEAKELTEKIVSKYLPLSIETIEEDNKRLYPYVEKFSEIVKDFGLEYDAIKRENNTIDFSDFEHLALKLLKNPDGLPSDIAISISNDFDEIYIDEYQDCNNIQNEIFECISGKLRGKPNIFCVGDMKQSIYSFRDSNPLLFRDKCDRFPLFDGGEVCESNKIFLSRNFRSNLAILNFANFVFSQIMTKDCGDIDYTDDEKLYYSGSYETVNDDTKSIDITLIDTSNTFGDSYDLKTPSELNPLEAEAVEVGKKINSIISSGYMLYDKKKGIQRSAEYKDIVILMRSVSTPAPVFEKVLSGMGIPVYTDKGGAYFEAEEIRFLMSLLKIIDNPDDDISLVTVMKNPVFGFDENMLLKIRLGSRQGSYYNCVRKYAETKQDELGEKLKSFLLKLDIYYKKSRYMDTDEFLSYIIRDTDYMTLLSLSSDSKLKKTNVNYLQKKAREFEKNGYRGIYSFVRFTENYKHENASESAKIMTENDNAVRIMTIHKSKGLEFPIVFLSTLGRQFNKSDSNAKIVMHKDYGIGIESVYRNLGVRYKSINSIAIKTKQSFEAISEELRVLYVALTRPMEKLFLTASISNASLRLKKIEDALVPENEKISPYNILMSNSMIDILLYSVMRASKYPKTSQSSFKKVIELDANFKVELLNINEITGESHSNQEKNWESFYDGPTESYEMLKENLEFEYTHKKSSLIPPNMTVTEIKRHFNDENDIYSPYDNQNLLSPNEFGKNRSTGGARYGTLIHFIMEKIDFTAIKCTEDVISQIKKLSEKNLITQEEFDILNVDSICKFFESDLAQSVVLQSDKLKKEYSFKYLRNASDIFGIDTQDKIVVQGTIDAFFEDSDGQIVVFDYKTDKITSDNTVSDIVKMYSSQLELYSHALEEITGKKVKEKYLYLFDAGEFVLV